MATMNARGPFGAILALGNLDIEFHGVRVRRVSNGKPSLVALGDGNMRIFYLDGKRSSYRKAWKRLAKHIAEDEYVTLEGPLQ